MLKAPGVFAEDQGGDSFAAVQLGQRPAGLNVAKMRGQQQLALRRRDVKRFARAGGKDHVAIKLQLTAPAGDFIQHRVAEAHEMEKAVEPRGNGHVPLTQLVLHSLNPLPRGLARRTRDKPVHADRWPEQHRKGPSPHQLPDAQHQAHAPQALDLVLLRPVLAASTEKQAGHAGQHAEEQPGMHQGDPHVIF